MRSNNPQARTSRAAKRTAKGIALLEKAADDLDVAAALEVSESEAHRHAASVVEESAHNLHADAVLAAEAEYQRQLELAKAIRADDLLYAKGLAETAEEKLASAETVQGQADNLRSLIGRA